MTKAALNERINYLEHELEKAKKEQQTLISKNRFFKKILSQLPLDFIINNQKISTDELESNYNENVENIHIRTKNDASSLAKIFSFEKRFNILIKIYEQIPIGICLINAGGKIITFNNFFSFICGYVPEDLQSKPFSLLIPFPKRPDFENQLKNHLNHNSTLNYTSEFVSNNGEISKVLLHSINCPFFDSKQEGMIIFVQDITASEKTEQSRQMLWKALNETNDLSTIKDTDLRIIAANKSFLKITGASGLKEIIGKTDAEIFKNQADAKTINTYMADDRKAQQLKPGEHIEREEIAYNPDGTQISIFTRKFPIFDQEEQLIGSATISTDITLLKKAGEELMQLNQKLEEKVYEKTLDLQNEIKKQKRTEKQLEIAKQKAIESDHLKTAFLANMSHEIRTPMNAIIGFAQLLAEGEFTNKEKKEYIELINSSGYSLLNLIDDIIDIAKIESEQINIKEQNVNLDKVLFELYLSFNEQRKRMGKENVELQLSESSGGNSLKIITDPFRLKQVLSNLLSNALKFTEKGFVEFGYVIRNNLTIQFFVRDTGVGIAQEKQENIFDRFSQIRNERVKDISGTGLGLTISKKLVDLMGGKIWLNSMKNKGSVFYFTIPFKNSVAEKIQKKKKELFDNFLWKNKTILVVEDLEVNFTLIEEILQRTQVHLLWAQNGKEAVEMCKNNTVDLVLMDIYMPVMDGFKATREIKKMHPNLPVISQTAYAMSGEREKSLEAGCDDYIPKPINTSIFLSKIGKFFQKK